jgi:hypothetical protein
MNSNALFTVLNSKRIAALVATAKQRVCYAAPGLQLPVAEALCAVAPRLPAGSLTVSIDLDERVMRMGYGEIAAPQQLQAAQIPVRNSPGLRTAVLIVDDTGFIFTPTALYLEDEPHSEETPNAIRLSPEQLNEVLIRLSPAAKAEAAARAHNDAERARIEQTPVEVGVASVTPAELNRVAASLEQAPPVKFDIARQVRVFEPYLQYVELSLTGAAIQRHRIAIPKDILKLGSTKDLEGRLRTTFDLIEKSSQLSSKALEDALNEIRKNYTPSLGKDHGRVVLKAAKPHLQRRLEEFRQRLIEHQAKVSNELQKKLDDSRTQVIEYYLPLAKKNPPDALLGQVLFLDDVQLRAWLEAELASVFPAAEDLLSGMNLDERYKDVTFETLNRKDFLEAVQKAFPKVDWEKAYSEFLAAGQTQTKP